MALPTKLTLNIVTPDHSFTHDDVPEQAFYLVGGIDDVVARAEEMKSSAAA